MKLRVVGPRCLVKQLEPSEVRTQSGLVLPKEAGKDEVRGIVVACGVSTRYGGEPPVEVGDVVWDSKPSYRPHPPLVTIMNDDTHAPEVFVVLDWLEVLLVLDDAQVEATHHG